MLSLLIAAISWLGVTVLGEILGAPIGAVLRRLLRFIYAPPHGLITLAFTWLATLALGYALATADGEQSAAVVLGFLALAGLGFIGMLTFRDMARERKHLPPVQTRIPARFGGGGRLGLTLLGATAWAVAALAWSTEGRGAWEVAGGSLLFGSACFLGAVTGRLPAWVVHLLRARLEPPKSIPPAG
jgi:hypothetical protein